MSETTYKIDWVDLEKTLTGGAALLTQLVRLRQSFSKGRRPKRDLKKLGEEIDGLRKDFETLLDLLQKYFSKHTEFVEAVGRGFATFHKAREVFGAANLPKVTKIVLSHHARLDALEASIAAGKKKTVRKRKRKPQH